VSQKSLLRHHPSGCQSARPVWPTGPTHVASLYSGPTGPRASAAAQPGPMSCDASPYCVPPPQCAPPPNCFAPPYCAAPQCAAHPGTYNSRFR
jgi:hypothetical protein